MDHEATFIRRLKRRKLVQWTAGYCAAAAAVFGTLATVGEVFAWPWSLLRALFFLLVAGLPVTIVLAWFHGERGRQRVSAAEAVLLSCVGVCGIAAALYSLRTGATAAGAGATEGARLLVLPFTDAGAAGELQYLGDGIAGELRQTLSTFDGISIASGSGASHVLDGTVLRSGDQLTISARLTDGAATLVWRDTYRVPVTSLLETEDRIAVAVARALRPGDPSLSVAHTRTTRVHPAAHDRYLRGEYALKQRSPASVVQAIAEYRAAASLDPGMTAAIAREAYAYALFIDWGWPYPGLSNVELMRRGIELSDRAVRQDSLSAEAWLARAYLLQLRDPLRLQGAADAFGRAVALDPTNAEAQHQYGQTLMVQGRYAEAKAAYYAALAVEPDRPLTLVPLSAIALREGDLHAAQRWSDSAVALARDAPYPWTSRAQLRLVLGDAAGARDDAENALRVDPSYELTAQSALAAAFATLGDTAAASQALRRARGALIDPSRPSPTEAYYLAAALLRNGRREEALAVASAAIPAGAWFWFYFQSPLFDELRSDERFRSLLARADPRG